MEKRILLIILIFFLASCSNPERTFKKAEESRSKEIYQKLINDFPQSDLVKKAQNRILDIESWEKIKSSQTKEPYENYLKEYPDGLFRKDAQIKIQEIEDFSEAKNKDVIETYNAFLGQYPNSTFTQEIKNRTAELIPAEESYQMIKSEDGSDALKAYVDKYIDTGYGKLIFARLSKIALGIAEANVLGEDIYKELPDTLVELQNYIKTNTNAKNINLAKQALIAIFIEQIKITGPGDRFAIYPIVTFSDFPLTVKSQSNYFKLTYRIEYKEPSPYGFHSQESILPSEALSSIIIAGTGSIPERNPYDYRRDVSGWVTISQNSDGFIFTTELPNERIFFGHKRPRDLGPSASVPYTGEFEFVMPYGLGSVFRFKGRVANLFLRNEIFEGDQEDPLCFAFLNGSRFTYICGKGKVTSPIGDVYSFPLTEPLPPKRTG